jgi:HEPN domain-containing protein
MNPLTTEWVEKAEKDFATASREFRARKLPNYDPVCFHSQQSAEKYLKAILQEWNISFSKTHNLTTLLGLITPREPPLGTPSAESGEIKCLCRSGEIPRGVGRQSHRS